MHINTYGWGQNRKKNKIGSLILRQIHLSEAVERYC